MTNLSSGFNEAAALRRGKQSYVCVVASSLLASMRPRLFAAENSVRAQ